MLTFAIIDDNSDQSGTLKRIFEYHLGQIGVESRVITQHPFRNIEDYFKYIQQNDISAILLDERLNDLGEKNQDPVVYKGNQLIRTLREVLKDFPVFMVTTYPTDKDVQSQFNQFEVIIGRQDFIDHGEKYTPIIVRSAQRFLNCYISELSEFDKLTQSVASGTSNPEDIEKLRALQLKLELPIIGFDDRKAWLDQFERQIQELEAIKQKLEEKAKNL